MNSLTLLLGGKGGGGLVKDELSDVVVFFLVEIKCGDDIRQFLESLRLQT